MICVKIFNKNKTAEKKIKPQNIRETLNILSIIHNFLQTSRSDGLHGANVQSLAEWEALKPGLARAS